MASALNEIANRVGMGLIYKTSFDKANRTSAGSKRGLGLERSLPILAEIREALGIPVLTDVHERAQWRTGRRSGRCPSDTGVSMPADRSSPRGGRDGQSRKCEEGSVSRTVGHEECDWQKSPERETPMC